MPKKKQVVSSEPTPPVVEPPVVFFLKVPPEFQETETQHEVVPDSGNITYADILEQETEREEQRFDQQSIHTILSKLHLQTTYPANAACFWCCHGFRWKSFVLPVQYDAYNEEYLAEGHFCSPECALGYLYSDIHVTDSQRWIRHSLLQSLYGPLYKEREIHPAPDRRCLRMFGGVLDIEQFRQYIRKSDVPLITQLPPIRLYVPSMNTHIPARDVKKYVALSSETMEKASNQLRIKRSKPVHTNVPTLDQCMHSN